MYLKKLIALVFTLNTSICIVPSFAQSAKSSDASIRAESMKFYELGNRYFENHLYSIAEKMFNKSISIDQKNHLAISRLGRLNSLHGNRVGAIDCFKKAMELDPSKTSLYLELLGSEYIDTGNYFEAETLLSKAIAIDPKMIMAYFNLGRLNFLLEKYDLSEQMYKKTIELDSTINTLAYQFLGELYSKIKKYDEGIALYEKWIKASPKDSNAYCALGNLYSDQGKGDLAEYMLKKGVDCDAKNCDALFELGNFYTKQKRIEEAEKMYKKAIEVDPNNSFAFFVLGAHYELQGKPSLAEYMFSKAIEIDPNNGVWIEFLARVQLMQGKREESIKNAKLAKSKGANAPELYEKLGL